ncbi:16S rRNA pseudouridine(516) synthase [Gemella sp. oral taxon 928]|uniref:pseudouridine synthase n=1 Tax=Gemella sp. oral taxon 928 TaxID=1785995 RepID=UPI0007683451|nr:pseudouridine synthase [Gemella sp. oral taxon 928]AME09311.1 16S rRNA pseudouridine(516) synthase [Gemella sp. oral taxon 928]
MRFDKFISVTTGLSRAVAKKEIKKGILVNNEIIKSVDFKINENHDIVIFNGKRLLYQKYIYIMMNKPKDVISATEDRDSKTVVDLLNDNDKIYNPHPVGRLDKDTVGLMFLTNDGELTHKLISPKKDIKKKYYLEVDGFLEKNAVEIAKKGIILEDGYRCKSAVLKVLSSNQERSTAYISITEGKFHQVKRMMKSLGVDVTYLKRISIGTLILDEDLKLGEYRYLTDKEIKNLKK